MNGLSLRISSGFKKPKKTMSLPPAVLTNFEGVKNELIESFLKAASAEEQLGTLKKLLASDQDNNLDTITFLVFVFFHSEAKHPVKCFVNRYITKSEAHNQLFIQLLTTEIDKQLNLLMKKKFHSASNLLNLKYYQDVLHKVAMCIENFPPGTQAIENEEEQLADCLIHCLYQCQDIVRASYLQPSEKNTVYSLAHLALRLTLHILTKSYSEYNKDSDKMLKHNHARKTNLLFYVLKLLEDKDAPMDTKSLAGIVVLCLEAHYDRLNHPPIYNYGKYVSESHKMSDQVQVAMYSAIITLVPINNLQEEQKPDGITAFAIIIEKLMDIDERCFGDGVLILGVSRAVLLAARCLAALPRSGGRAAAARLLAHVWAHLDHYLDSVRHLAKQTLAAVLQYCAQHDDDGSAGSLSRVLAALGALGWSRGACAALAGAARAAGAKRVLRAHPLPTLLRGLTQEHVIAAATTTLNTLLELHSRETDTSVIHTEWVLPILEFIQTNHLESEVLTLLENLLAKAIKLDRNLLGYILPHIKEACSAPDSDFRRVLTLGSAVRAIQGNAAEHTTDDFWCGIIPYKILEEAIVDANDEVRIQCLSLVCGSSARGPAGALVLRYVRYAARDEPRTRTRAVAHIDKFLSRACAAGAAGAALAQELAAACARALAPGAAPARRALALGVLRRAAPHVRAWEPHHVDKLLRHLDDSYEANKALALDILMYVPVEMLKDGSHSTSLQFADVIRQANALKPSECISAAYKLELMWRRLPDNILMGNTCEVAEPALYKLLRELLKAAQEFFPRVWTCRYNVMLAPRDRPTYGLLYCMAHVIDRLDFQAINGDKKWNDLFERIVIECEVLIEETGEVVNNASPEGVMPQGCQYTDYGNNAGVFLEDGRLVTAQMVLLCAWRTSKEASSVLGALCARAPVPGALSPDRVARAAEALAHVVCSARHRGVFEQAYRALERALHRIWRDPDLWLNRFAKAQLESTLRWLRDGAAGAHGASRRSAGLPFFIQALVSTQEDRGALRDVMAALLAAAEPRDVTEPVTGSEGRARACNVLRALYRDASLEADMQGYVGEGLRIAIQGFDGASWEERNASTLLLSALIQRVFGVSRARASLTARDKMTGRVFFLRYPTLYAVMLDKLKEATESESKLLLCPSLYPVLLLLARLYPSSLEGTESNLKLVSFLPFVVRCARARVAHTRRLAAAAAVSLVPPDRYVSHLNYLLGLISEATVERNFCHGILLQICALLDNKPSGVDCRGIAPSLARSAWVLAQPAGRVCYPLLGQFVLLLATLHASFPETLDEELLNTVECQLTRELFSEGDKSRGAGVAAGRALCLSECLSLLLAIHERRGKHDIVTDLIVRGISHGVSEVSRAALEHLLRMCGRGDAGQGADFLRRNDHVSRDAAAAKRARAALTAALPAVRAALPAVRAALPAASAAMPPPAGSHFPWYCDPQRAYLIFEILVLEDCVDELILCAPPWHIRNLFTSDSILCSRRPDRPEDSLDDLISLRDGRMHLYLEALTRYISRLCEDNSSKDTYEELSKASRLSQGMRRVMRACEPGCPPEARAVAARFLRDNAQRVLDIAKIISNADISFEVEMHTLVSVSMVLRDEIGQLRAAAAAALPAEGSPRSVLPALAAERLLARCGRSAGGARRLAALGLWRAAPQPCSEHSPRPECRVFDENECDVNGEDDLWTLTCADKVIEMCAEDGVDPVALVEDLISNGKLGLRSDSKPAEDLFLGRLRGEVL